MSSGSDFKEKARQAKAIYEMVGASGASYVIFWFKDRSVCAAKRAATDNRSAASLDFQVSTTHCLDDCGVSDFEGTTYQKGAELLSRLTE
jgi:hypothetical protein